MKRFQSKKSKAGASNTASRSMSRSATKRASLFRNGANQAVRLPQELRFPAEVKEVRIRRQGRGLLISPIKPDWPSFFGMEADVPEDFLEDRNDSPPQTRDLV